MKTIILFSILFFSTSLFAGKIRDIDFSIDSSNFGFTNTFSITISLIKKNGKRIVMTPNEMSLYWNKIDVKGQHILSFKHGIITFNQAAIFSGNNSIDLDVSYNKSQHSIQKPIKFPYVTGLIIKNNIISVNHTGLLGYELIFSNGKTANPSPTLFDEKNFVNTSPFEVNLIGSSYMLRLDEPANYETVEVSINNRLDNQPLGKKIMAIEYPTTCIIDGSGNDGFSGTRGTDGKKTSENGTSGSSGGNGTSSLDVRVFAKMSTVNQTKYLIIQSFYSNNTHQTEILKYDGKPITVSANGGKGGNGGNGGDGMSGLINKEKQINSPIGGNGGNGGNAGSGGNAGNVYLVYTTETGDISSLLSINVHGGDAGIAGIGGKGGKGDYSDSKLVGKVLNTKDGKPGNIGVTGINGTSTLVNTPVILSNEEWNAFYQRHLKEGFVK